MLIAELFQFCIPVIHPGTLTAGSISYSNHDKWHSIGHIYLPRKPNSSITSFLPDMALGKKKLTFKTAQELLTSQELRRMNLCSDHILNFLLPSDPRPHDHLRGDKEHLPLTTCHWTTRYSHFLNVPPDLSGKEDFSNTALQHQHCWQGGLCDR